MKQSIRRALPLLLVAVCLLLTACGKSNYRDDLTAAAVLDSVSAVIPSESGYTAADGSYINESMWGEDYDDLLEDVANYRILLSVKSDVNIDEMGVFLVREADDVGDISRIVKEYVSAQQMRYKDLLASYNPDELPKLDNAKVTVCGRYVLYTILGESETVQAHNTFESTLRLEK